MNNIMPVFESDENEIFEMKTKELIQNELKKQRLEKDYNKESNTLEKDPIKESDTLEKIKEIRQRIDREKKLKGNIEKRENIEKENIENIEKEKRENSKINCPGCHKHDMHIHDDTAKCTGSECNKEFLMIEKHPEEKNKYMCTSCGHSMTESRAIKLRDDKKSCPLCEKGDTVIDINWENMDKDLKKILKKQIK